MLTNDANETLVMKGQKGLFLSWSMFIDTVYAAAKIKQTNGTYIKKYKA